MKALEIEDVKLPGQINGYSDSGFRVDNAWYEGSVLITPNKVLPWHELNVSNWHVDDFSSLFENNTVDTLLIGSGKHNVNCPMQLQEFFHEKHINFEFLNTKSAISVWSSLLLDGRNAAAIFLPLAHI